MELILRGEKIRLLPERAVFLERTRTLLVADLHWGKAETFQSLGIRVPASVLTADLDRLSRAAEEARRVLVLGDLVHSPGHLGEKWVDEITAWRRKQKFSLELIPGNHDRYLELPPSWQIDLHPACLVEEPFLFTHAPIPSEHFVWSGHVHPMLRLKSRADRLRLACFSLSEALGLLPAFSEFTGGVDLKPQAQTRFFGVVGSDVVELTKQVFRYAGTRACKSGAGESYKRVGGTSRPKPVRKLTGSAG